jgi:diguanylate cyclase (GGDEF)-like protein
VDRPAAGRRAAEAGDALTHRLRELEALHESLRALTATLDLGELLQTLLARMRTLLQPQGLSLLLYDRAHDELVFAATELLREDAVLEPGVIDGARLRLDQGIAGWVARHREAVLLDDASRDPRHEPGMARAAGLVPHGMICVPVVHRDRLLGVVQVINRLDGRPFTADEQRLVQSLADYAAVGIAHAQLYREVELASLTDDLTGLGNTRRFHRELPRLLARATPLSLLVLDLDHLKAVVDTHGHLVGSRTIATVGRLIAEQLRPGDVAARFGGDEFVAVLPSTDTGPARDIAELVCAAVAACAVPDGLEVDITGVTASLGVATAPRHALDPDGLFRAADAAMYDVKRRRRNGVAVAKG